MFGLLNVYKPPGVTSRDVVNLVQRLARPAKVGHAGTLDPLASGVLIVCLGRATRLIQYVQDMPKQYSATFLLGRRSDTDDVDGRVVEVATSVRPGRGEIEAALPAFVGIIQQRPPSISAMKVSGQRAYARSRRGELVTLKERPVNVHNITLVSYDYPVLRLIIECGAGTYVRAIGRDVAESLGTSAVMSELTRTAIGSFNIEDAVRPEALTKETLGEFVLPALRALDGQAILQLDDDALRRVVNGQFLNLPDHGFQGPVAAVNSAGELMAVLRPYDADQLRPETVLCSGNVR